MSWKINAVAIHFDISLPFKILDAGLSHSIMEGSHGLHHTILNSRRARDVELGQEVVCHCNQCILWPAGEPIHGTTTNQAGKLQRAVSKFLSNLQ